MGCQELGAVLLRARLEVCVDLRELMAKLGREELRDPHVLLRPDLLVHPLGSIDEQGVLLLVAASCHDAYDGPGHVGDVRLRRVSHVLAYTLVNSSFDRYDRKHPWVHRPHDIDEGVLEVSRWCSRC